MVDTAIERGTGRLFYQQIIDAMMEQIRSGSFSYEKPICTENELMEHYGVSRITVRRALAELGILYRKRGVGSFVCQDIYQKTISSRRLPPPLLRPAAPCLPSCFPSIYRARVSRAPTLLPPRISRSGAA